jgi:hypothetical protein
MKSQQQFCNAGVLPFLIFHLFICYGPDKVCNHKFGEEELLLLVSDTNISVIPLPFQSN